MSAKPYPFTPLLGIRVVELGDGAAAFAGKLLAGLGAEITKLEPPSGSRWRRSPPSDERFPGRSSLFTWYHESKQCRRLDLRTAAGKEELGELLRTSDAVISALSPRRLNLDSLPRTNPSLLVIDISPFGRTGGRKSWRSSDLVLQAAGGFVLPNGFLERPPLPGFGLQAYHCGGLNAAVALLLALVARRSSGCGQRVDVTIQRCLTAWTSQLTARYRERGQIVLRRGGCHIDDAFRVLRCADGHVVGSVLGDATTLRSWLEIPALPLGQESDPEGVYSALARKCSDSSAAEIEAEAQLRRLPFAAVLPTPILPTERPAAPWSISDDNPPIDIETRCARPDTHERREPLAGMRVLDLTWNIAGPCATRLLADYGAEVIKLERPTAVDLPPRDLLFSALNRGKQSIAVDLAATEGAALVRTLTGHCDLVVDNFSARVMPNLGLASDALRAQHPELITVHLGGYHRQDARRHHVAYAPTLHAAAGFTALMADPELGPAGWGWAFSDFAAGWAGALAMIAAWLRRQATGTGCHLEFSQFDNLLGLLGPAVLTGAVSLRATNPSQEGIAVPHGLYRCADEHGEQRWCAISVRGDDSHWRRFVAAIGQPRWAMRKGLGNVDGRWVEQHEVNRRVSEWTSNRRAAWVAARLQRFGIAAAVAADAATLCADPDLHAGGYWMDIPAAGGGKETVDGRPFELGPRPAAISRPAPRAGEHTDAILTRLLSYDQRRLAQLRRARVIA